MKLKLIMQFLVCVFNKSVEDEQHKTSRLFLQGKLYFLAMWDSLVASEMNIY